MACWLIVTRYVPPGRGSSSASIPFQRTMRTGSVKKPKIVSGRAAMRTSRSTTSAGFASTTPDPPLLQLGLLLEAGELLVPEFLDEAAQPRQAPPPGAIQPPPPPAPPAHPPRPPH